MARLFAANLKEHRSFSNLTKRTVEALRTEAKEYFVWDSQIPDQQITIIGETPAEFGRVQLLIDQFFNITACNPAKLAKHFMSAQPVLD